MTDLHRRQVTLISGEVTFAEAKSPVLKGTLRPPHRKLVVYHLNPLGYDGSSRELESRECIGMTLEINVTPLRAMAAQTFSCQGLSTLDTIGAEAAAG